MYMSPLSLSLLRPGKKGEKKEKKEGKAESHRFERITLCGASTGATRRNNQIYGARYKWI